MPPETCDAYRGIASKTEHTTQIVKIRHNGYGPCCRYACPFGPADAPHPPSDLARGRSGSDHRSGCKSAVLGSKRSTQTSLRWPSAQTSLRLESYVRPTELLKSWFPISSGPANFTPNQAFAAQS